MIVGITGRAGAGKDTVADILREHHKFLVAAFARPLKRMLSSLLCVKDDMWEDRVWKEEPVPGIGHSPRYLAQTLGTEWGRNCLGENFWVDMAFANAEEGLAIIEKSLGDRYNLVFSDCRFENEAAAIRNRGGTIIHIERPGVAAATMSQHESENGIMFVQGSDIRIMNDASILDLHGAVLSAVQDMKMREEANAAI